LKIHWKISVYILIYCAPFSTCIGQTIQSITGNVINDQGEHLVGNVVAIHPSDSTFITGTSYFNESFKLEKITEGQVLLQFTSILFPDTIIVVNYIDNQNVALGDIVINNTGIEMEEVTIKGKLSRIMQLDNGTIEVTVENTSLESSGTIEEVLTRSPGVIINEDGYSVIGKETTIFYVNGKRVNEDQINLIHPSNIKKVEIIRNPSAKYDADGGAVINIKTLSINSYGYQIKLQQNFSYSNFFGSNTRSSANFNYAKEAFQLKGSYAMYRGDYNSNLHTTRDRDREEIYLQTDLNTEWYWHYKPSSIYSLGLQYDFDQNNYFSVEYSGMFEKIENVQISNNLISNRSSTNQYNSNIDDHRKNTQNSVSTNYYKSIDTLGSSLFVGMQYSDIKYGRDNEIVEKSIQNDISSSRLLESFYNQKIEVSSAQIDYIKFLTSANSFELGAKISNVSNDVFQDFFTSNDGFNFVLDSDLSNLFNYEERIGAAYIIYNSKMSDILKLSIGLRNEYTNYTARFSNDINAKLTNSFLNLFPSLSFQLRLPNKNALNISFTSSIGRPPYQDLSPVTIYQDPYTSIRGNPNLIAQKTYSVSANTTMWNTNVEIGYNYTMNPLDAGALRGDDEFSYILQNLNYDCKHKIYTTVSRTFNYKWLTSINTVNVSYINMLENELDVERLTVVPSVYLHTNNIINIKDICRLEILFWYSGIKNSGIFRERERSSLNLTLEKKFLQNDLTIRLQANDIFHNAGPAGNYNIGETDIFYEREFSTQFFRISASYNVGSLKKISYKNKSTGNSELNRAN